MFSDYKINLHRLLFAKLGKTKIFVNASIKTWAQFWKSSDYIWLRSLTIAHTHFTVQKGKIWIKKKLFSKICAVSTVSTTLPLLLHNTSVNKLMHFNITNNVKQLCFIPLVSVLLNEVSSCCSISVSIFFWQRKKFGGHLGPNSRQQRGERNRKLAPVSCGDLSALLWEERSKKSQAACSKSSYSRTRDVMARKPAEKLVENRHSPIFITGTRACW